MSGSLESAEGEKGESMSVMTYQDRRKILPVLDDVEKSRVMGVAWAREGDSLRSRVLSAIVEVVVVVV